MFKSEHFGRAFWVDVNNEFRSCPLFVNNKPDFDQVDYVSERTDLEGINLDKLLNIHKIEILNAARNRLLRPNNDFNLTEDVYNEVKKCYNSSNPEEVIWHGN